MSLYERLTTSIFLASSRLLYRVLSVLLLISILLSLMSTTLMVFCERFEHVRYEYVVYRVEYGLRTSFLGSGYRYVDYFSIRVVVINVSTAKVEIIEKPKNPKHPIYFFTKSYIECNKGYLYFDLGEKALFLLPLLIYLYVDPHIIEESITVLSNRVGYYRGFDALRELDRVAKLWYFDIDISDVIRENATLHITEVSGGPRSSMFRFSARLEVNGGVERYNVVYDKSEWLLEFRRRVEIRLNQLKSTGYTSRKTR